MKNEYGIPYNDSWYNPKKADCKEIGPRMIAFDFDSTINDMGEPLGRYIAKMLGCSEDEARAYGSQGERLFHFEREGVSDEAMSQLVRRYVLEESPSLLPTPWAMEVLAYIWSVTGQPITVITYRQIESVEVTYTWLRENLSVPFTLIMLHGMQKDVVLRRLDTQVFIDDRYKTISKLEGAISMPVLYSRPWNQGRQIPAGAMAVTDLRGLIPIINFMTRTNILTWPVGVPYPGWTCRGKKVDLYA